MGRVNQILQGIIPPLVTPLVHTNRLDLAGLERLLEHLISGRVNGVFLLGSTGEGPHLSLALKKELITNALSMLRGRVPVIVGALETSFAETVSLSEHAAAQGAAAIVVAPPYYYPEGQPELLEYFQDLCRAVPIPTILYNIPQMTKVWIELQTLERLLSEPAIIGMKDSSGDLVYFNRVARLARQLRPDFVLFMGPEELLLDGLIAGASGGTPGGANLFPELFVALYRTFLNRDWDKAWQLHQVILTVSQELYTIGKYASAPLKGIKCALAIKGICDDTLALPFRKFREPERRLVESKLTQLDELVQNVIRKLADVPEKEVQKLKDQKSG